MKLEVESDKFDMLCGTVQMGSVKLEQESTNVETESNKLDMSCAKVQMDTSKEEVDHCPVRLAYKPYFFSQRTVFFSHNKSVNNTFSHDLSAKRTGPLSFANNHVLWTRVVDFAASRRAARRV